MWPWIKKSYVEKLLATQTIPEIAKYFGISVQSMYKYTFTNKIDVWACKAKYRNIEKLKQRKKKKIQNKVYHNVVYGDLTAERLSILIQKYTSKQICILYKINRNILKYLAGKWKISLRLPKQKKEKPKASLQCKRCNRLFFKLNDGYCTDCTRKLKEELAEVPSNKFGQEIYNLRLHGLTYSQIANKIGCARSTVSYYCTKGVKEKSSKRHKSYVKTYIGKFVKHLDNFTQTKFNPNCINMCKDYNKKFRTTVSKFRTRYISKGNLKMEYSYKKALKHLGGWNTHCYLTGRPINIQTDNYSLDHIIPVSKGGTNELSNMGITIPVANQMKTDMTLDEFFSMCIEILQHNGYKVTKL